MKKILIALTLVAAFAAPAMAEGFPNPYQTTMSRQAHTLRQLQVTMHVVSLDHSHLPTGARS